VWVEVALATDMAAGSVALQVSVTDELAPKPPQVASQWIDFDIAPRGDKQTGETR
jgi:hypothetical protein